jgi:hypothetical protein
LETPPFHSRLDGVRVLIVDDTRSVLDAVTDMLKQGASEWTVGGLRLKQRSERSFGIIPR